MLQKKNKSMTPAGNNTTHIITVQNYLSKCTQLSPNFFFHSLFVIYVTDVL